MNEFLAELMTLPDIYGAKISPDGKLIAFMWYRINENFDIFIVPVDGAKDPVELTHTPQMTRLVGWTADSKAIIVSEDVDRNERYQISKIDLAEPLIFNQLTEYNPPFFMYGGRLHPNNKWLVYGANYDFEKEEVLEPSWLYRHDLETGEKKVLAKPDKPAWYFPQFNPEGSQVIYSKEDRDPSGNQYWLVSIEGENDVITVQGEQRRPEELGIAAAPQEQHSLQEHDPANGEEVPIHIGSSHADTGGEFSFEECIWGQFFRQIILPQEVDPGRAVAKVKDGVLVLHLPLKEVSDNRIKMKIVKMDH